MAGPNSQRIDKWLWFARVVKSRTLAQTLVSGGYVRVNGDKVSAPSRAVSPGDVLTIVLERQVKVLRVRVPGTRRGPAPEAQLLYEDLSPLPAPKLPQPAEREPGSGRPSKRDRRQIDAFRETAGGADKDFADDGE